MVIFIKTIKEEITNEIEIKNSKFIARIIPAEKEEITTYLEQIKTEYPKATHYCYAYINKEYQKSSDDNEPTGTAGKPILNVLEKEKLEKVLVIIIRYFGGIKLGAGGLIRAYTKATTEALQKAHFQEVVDAVKNLSIKLGIPQTLREIGIPEEMLPTLAKQAINDACTPGNPRDVSKEDFINLYRAAM